MSIIVWTSADFNEKGQKFFNKISFSHFWVNDAWYIYAWSLIYMKIQP